MENTIDSEINIVRIFDRSHSNKNEPEDDEIYYYDSKKAKDSKWNPWILIKIKKGYEDIVETRWQYFRASYRDSGDAQMSGCTKINWKGDIAKFYSDEGSGRAREWKFVALFHRNLKGT